jgi:hypothetical protein
MLKIATIFSKTNIHKNFVTSQCIVLFGACQDTRTHTHTHTAKCFTNTSKQFWYIFYFVWECTNDLLGEYAMFTPAQLLHNWPQQWPSNQGDLDSSVVGRLGHWERGVDLILISFLYYNTELLLGCILNVILCISLVSHCSIDSLKWT